MLVPGDSVGLPESLPDMMKYGSYNYNSLAFIPSEFAYGEDHTIKAGYAGRLAAAKSKSA